jgi:hypothetical protein
MCLGQFKQSSVCRYSVVTSRLKCNVHDCGYQSAQVIITSSRLVVILLIAVTDKDGPHVLLVSHHTSRQAVLKVRNRLRGLGYHVHIDPDLRTHFMILLILNPAFSFVFFFNCKMIISCVSLHYKLWK